MTSPQGIGLPINFNEGGIEVIDAPVDVSPSCATTTLSSANTVQSIWPSGNAYNFLIITNLSSSDTIKIGSYNSQTLSLAPGQSVFFDVHQAPLQIGNFYFIGPNAGDTVGVLWA